jgi:hypothetical protein
MSSTLLVCGPERYSGIHLCLAIKLGRALYTNRIGF